ncbi:CBS domain-containing protein, partial [Streptomyces acidiscabies]|uniref:CBS domain-containing protein n=1 Tax=Streptomyces acidiscabies TaxID=42234 RepID=UPI000B143C2A
MKPIEVGALMTHEVVTARYGTPFKEVVRLLDDHRIGGLPVVDEDGTVIGVISATDLVPHQAVRTGVRHRFSPRARRPAARSRS